LGGRGKAGWNLNKVKTGGVAMDDTGNPMREWTVLGYLAGDNNLDGAAVEDINEMEVVGSTDQVNVVVQVDRAADYNLNNDN
jgi:hypothetical protein